MAETEEFDAQAHLDSLLTEGEETTVAPSSEEVVRDESGRFAKKEAEPEKAKEVVVPATEEKASPETSEQPPQKKRPPNGWTAQAKALWDSLPPEIQDEAIRVDENLHKGLSEYKGGFQRAQQLDQILNPYLPMIQSAGRDPMQHIAGLLQFQYELQTNPQRTLAQLAQQFGITPEHFTQQPQVDPAVFQLQKEVHRLHQMLAQGSQQTAQQVANQANAEIEKFSRNPENVYFHNVREKMAGLLNSGLANSLDDAYAQACMLDEGVRSAIQAKQLRDAEQKRIDEAKAKAANARRAAFDVQGSGTVNMKPEIPDDITEHLRQVAGAAG